MEILGISFQAAVNWILLYVVLCLILGDNPLKRKHPSAEKDLQQSVDKARTDSRDNGKLVNGAKTNPVPRAVIFPEADKNQALSNAVSREFAEEFHKSVLQTTRQQAAGTNSLY